MVAVTHALRVIGLGLLLAPAEAWSAKQQPKIASAVQVIADLTSEERNERIAGFNALVRIPPEERTDEMNAALVECLENELAMRQAIIAGRMPRIPWDASHDFVLLLMDSVQDLRDPAHIPLFANLTEHGAGVRNWLVSFGRLTLPALFVRIDGTRPALEREIFGVVTTLRFLIEAWGLDYFTLEERAEFSRLAAQFLDLKPGEYPTDDEHWNWLDLDRAFRSARLAGAMQLAWALEEPELREHVMAIGSDREALRLRGIVDEGSLRIVNRDFERIVAGEPPMLRYSIRME